MKTNLTLLATLTLLLASASVSFGQWTQTATGNYSYTDGANWTGGNINGVFPNSLVISGNNTIVVNPTFSANTTLTTGLQFFQLQTAGSRLILTGSGAGNQTVTLGGDVQAYPSNLGSYNGVAGFGSTTAAQFLNVNLGGVTRTFDIWTRRAGGIGFELANGVSNGGVTMTGPGTLGISGNTTFTGPLTVSRGSVWLSGAGTLATTTINLGAGQGYFGASPFIINGTLYAGNRENSNIGAATTSLGNRIADNATINSAGGTLQVGGQFSGALTETVGTVNLQSGASTIAAMTADNNLSVSTSNAMTVAITTLNRSAGATAVFGGSGKGSSNGWSIGQTAGQVGGNAFITFGNGTSQNVGGIIPWGVIGTTGSGMVTSNALAFATYDATVGIKPYGYTPAFTTVNSTSTATGAGTEIVGAYANTLADATIGSGNFGNVKLTAADTTSGNYTVNSLTLAANVGAVTDDRTVTVNSGAILSTAYARIFSTLDVNGKEAIFYGNSAGLDITGQIKNTDGNGVTISGNALGAGFTSTTSSVKYTVAQTNYTGQTTVNSGIIALAVANAIPIASAVRVDPNGMINMQSGNQTWASLSGDGKVEFANQNTGGALTNTLTIGSSNADTTFSGLFSSTFSTGTATGGNLTKVGTGALTLSGASSTYSGTTSVANGSLVVANNTYSAAPNRTVAINIGTDLITLASHGLTNGQTVIFTSANSNPGSTNTVFQASTPMIVTNVATDTFQVSPIAAGAPVDFTSTGTTVQVMVPGALGNNNTAIQLGTAATGASDNISLLVGGAFTMGRDVTVNNQNSSGTTTLGGNTAAASTFSGNVALSKSINLTAATGGNSTFSGAISGSGFGVTKTGNGTVTLSNTNSYTGVTTISRGTLLLASTGSISNSSAIDFTTSGNGTLNVSGVSGFQITANQTLRGTGTVIGNLTVASSGILAPGNSPGTITFDNNLTLASGSVSNFEINGFTTGLYDLAQGGAGPQTVNFDGTLNLTFQSGFNTQGTVKIFDFETYAGSFLGGVTTSGLASGYTASFSALDGIVTVVPEPTTWMLLAFSLTALMVFRRRRQQF